MGLMAELTADLRAETEALERVLGGLTDEQWELATPADGWAVRDQVSHLAWFDDAAALAVREPAAFRAQTLLVGEGTVDDIAAESRGMSVPDLRAWFERAREGSLVAFAGLQGKERLPWYGPDMSAVSFVTARLMETWAHGQDVADAAGVTREPTARLRHVAQIGVRALPYSFLVNGLEVPREPVRVELELPDGTPWSAGPEGAADVVRGSVLGFCLAVTQRAHLADTDLRVEGQVARAWMAIAQAFAGPPGKGRAPSGKTRMI
ncbi:TIGR03084 family metal-binding protein [Nonomuraea sp. NBC_01738]|uniref:TIGR03084 family metal-binding protein n=1 Tax=Nonomuraea sp. NBC_01738 TaxID=2976003 RepID=UPI002E0F4B01|nr:TIGR03084 family metal-binding protein [Nonomuraea sp. NBC_01738]